MRLFSSSFDNGIQAYFLNWESQEKSHTQHSHFRSQTNWFIAFIVILSRFFFFFVLKFCFENVTQYRGACRPCRFTRYKFINFYETCAHDLMAVHRTRNLFHFFCVFYRVLHKRSSILQWLYICFSLEVIKPTLFRTIKFHVINATGRK